MKFRYRWLNLNSKVYFGLIALWVVLQTTIRVRVEQHSSLEWEAGLTVLFMLVVRSLLIRGFFRARLIIYLAQISWIAVEMTRAVLNHDWTGFFLCLSLVATAYGFYHWLESNLNQSAINPLFRWYEGRPAVLPRIMATDEAGKIYGIRSIDENGIYIISEEKGLIPKPQDIRLQITFKDQVVPYCGKVISFFEREVQGFGLQFCPANLYDQTQYTGLVQRIKGEGIGENIL